MDKVFVVIRTYDYDDSQSILKVYSTEEKASDYCVEMNKQNKEDSNIFGYYYEYEKVDFEQ